MITPERVYKVFGITPGPWEMTGSDNHLIATKGDGINTIIGEFWRHNKDENSKLCIASPEMLVALVNMVIDYQSKYYGNVNLNYSIKAIESADHKNRPWSELLEELTK